MLTRLGRRLLALLVLATSGLVGRAGSAQAQSCTGGTESDFDGDGLADLVIAAPDATVSGQDRAGRIHIAYGDTATQTVSQLNIADNDNAAGDRFGHTLASTDWNGDGCSDLFVGMPLEDWTENSRLDAGVVAYIPGSPSGLNTAAAQTWAQQSFGTAAGAETGDQFGYSLAAGTMRNGTPFLVSGAPGESVGTIEDAGMLIYATPSNAVLIHQDSDGVAGTAELGDHYGYSLAASPSAFAAGGPGDAIGDLSDGGMFQVFAHNNAAAIPPLIGSVDQDTTGVSGGAEPGDMLGYAIAVVDYIPAGGGVSTLVVVSSPTEDDTAGNRDTGWVFEFGADGTVAQKATFDQDTAGVDGAREDGDLFGASLSLVNRTPGEPVDWDDLLLSVGAPGEDVESQGLIDRGWVQVFSMIGAAGEHDVSATDGLEQAGAHMRSGMQLGISVHATADYLYLADPWATEPAVYGVPWDGILLGVDAEILVYTPADFGFTDAASDSFGIALE